PDSLAYSVHKEFGFGAIRVYLHHFFLSGFAPAYRPAMAIDMRHGPVSPVGLEDVIGFLFVEVTFHYAFLVSVWHRIFRPDGCGEILERPIGGTGKPGHGLLFLEVPVDEVNDVAFAPVAVFGYPSRSTEQRSVTRAFVGRCTVHHG